MNLPELNISNAHFNYRNWRGIYDVDRMMKAIVRCNMAPFEVCWIYPLCITEDNAVYALNVLNNLRPSYVQMLDHFVRVFSLDDVFKDMSNPEYQHFVIDGQMDPRYVNGLRTLKQRIEEEGELLPGSKREVHRKPPGPGVGHSPPDHVS